MSDTSQSSVLPKKRGKSIPNMQNKRVKKESSVAERSSTDDSNSTNSAGRQKNDLPSWPFEFQQLELVFRSLNTVYTFFCIKNTVSLAFDNLKSGIENLSKRFLRLKTMLIGE